MSDVMVHQEGFTPRCQKVLQVAKELFTGKPDWVTFFRETLGVSGAARSVFPTQQEYVLFEKSREYTDIQNMVLALRNRKIPGGGANEPTRVITVRLPESLHEALKAEASDHNTSMNKLCISKLLQVLVESQQNAQASQLAGSRMTAPLPSPSVMMPKPVPSPAIPQTTASSTPSFRSTFSQPIPSPMTRPMTPGAPRPNNPGGFGQ